MAKQRKTGPRKTRTGRVTMKKAVRQQPETLRLRGVTPKFTVRDLHASIRWYTEVLGFIVGEEWKDGGQLKGVELKAGAVTLMLDQDDFAKGRDRVLGDGVRLYCRTIQNLDQLAEGIRTRGGAMTQMPTDQPWGARDLVIQDPDGYKITLFADL
jgi:uncharacterized glyoxalase superfamily protein PhnB